MIKLTNSIKFILVLSTAVFLVVGCAQIGLFPQKTPPPMASGADYIMDTVVEQRWYGENCQLAYDEIVKELRSIENKLSLYVSTSEIAKINDNAGIKAVEVSTETYDIIKTAIRYSEESLGLFDISIAPLTKVWNITGDNPTVPPEEKITAAKLLVNYKDIIFNDENSSIMLAKKGMSLDLGGVAKGMAATMVADIPEKYKVTGYLSMGGNMMVAGKKYDGEDFKFGIRDPKGSQSDYLASVVIEGMTMATTGTYERFFEENGVRYHHILSPFTGYPVQSDLVSVTIISKDGGMADYLSTFIFMNGLDTLSDFLESESYFVIAVDDKNNVYTSPAYRDKITPNPDNTVYNFVGY